MSLRTYIIGQFKQPCGLIGKVVGHIMARRSSNIKRNRWTVDLLQLNENHQVLEIGCGPGLALKQCSDKIISGHITGIDHSQTIVNQAQTLLHKEISEGKVSLQHADLNVISQKTNEFDRIYSINVVQFFPDLEEAYKNIYKSLKNEGIALTTYQPRKMHVGENDAHIKLRDIENAMTKAGFTNIRCHELPLKPIPVVAIQGTRAKFGLPER